MTNSVLRWGLFFLSLLFVGPIAYFVMSGVFAADGSHHVTALVNAGLVGGLLRTILALFMAIAVGIVSARLVSLNLGIFNAGIVMAWIAASMGSVDQVLRSVQSGSAAYRVSIEGLLLGGVTVAGVFLIARAFDSRPAPAPASTPAPPQDATPQTPGAIWADFGLVVSITVASGFLASWLVMQNMLKGQAIATGAAAAVISTVAAGLVVKKVNPVAIAAGLLALAVAGPIFGVIMHGSSGTAGVIGSGIVARATAGTLVNLARLVPMDWLAGGLIGLPIGRSLGLWLGEVQVRPESAPAH